MRSVRRLSVLALGLLAAVLASAQATFTWTGLGADNNVLTAENWEGNVAPTGSGTESWVFPIISPPTFSQFYPTLTTPLSVKDLTFNHPAGYYNLTGNAPLTVEGNITTYSYAQIDAPLVLTAGQHVFDTYVDGDSNTYGSLWINGQVSGSGGITKTDTGFLYLAGGNTYSGDTIINDGFLMVGGNRPLGYGTVVMNSGYLQADSAGAYLPNDFVFGPSVTFVSNLEDGGFSIGNGDGSTIRPAGNTITVNFYLTGKNPLDIDGEMQDGSGGPTTYRFSGFSTDNSFYRLSAFNSYTGGTIVTPGAAVIFESSSSLPESGLITVQDGGYVGVGSASVSPATFISRVDGVNSYGTIGFDGITVTDDIDLSSLNSSITLGTRTSATLSGQITPNAGGNYDFMSSGRLFLTGEYGLNGSRNLSSNTLFFADTRGMLVLGQSTANTYSGATVANQAAIIFDQPGTLSAGTSLSLLSGGYVGFTETSGLNVSDLVNQIGFQDSAPGVIGIDLHDAIYSYAGTPGTYTDNIDLGPLYEPVYLGTASHMTLSGNIFTTNDDSDDYYFTGYEGGQLTIQAQLSGSRAVHIGLPGEPNSYSSVTLDNSDNNFTGGVILNSGVLFAPSISALGAGPITADTQYTNSNVALVTSGTLGNDISIVHGTALDVSPDATPLELAGDISGDGSLAIRSLEGAQVTLSGNNSYSGDSYFGSRAVITANSDTALGTSQISLTEGASVHFNTSAPVIGSLMEGSSYVQEGDYFEQDAAIIVGGGGPTATLTIDQVNWGHFAGAILEDATTLSVVINGGGHLELDGYNHDGNNPYPVYSGGTTINDGILVAGSNNALGSGTITLNGANATLQTGPGVVLDNAIVFGTNGGVLRGNGTFNTPITVGSNVVLAPGSSPGTLDFASGLTLGPGGSLNFEVQYANGAAGVGYDLVTISGGTLDITATSGTPFTIYLTSLNLFSGPGDVTDFNAASNYSWMLFQGNSVGGLNNFNASSFNLDLSSFSNNLAGGSFTLTQGVLAGDPVIYLNFTAVPEPSTWALLGVGLAAGFLTRRRRA